MIPKELWQTSPLPEKAQGEILVRISNPKLPDRYRIVHGHCPKCQLGPFVRLVTGWISLSEQSFAQKAKTDGESYNAVRAQILKNPTSALASGVEAKTGLPGAVIQRCPHCAYGTGPKPFFQTYGGAPNTWECPACGGIFCLKAEPVKAELVVKDCDSPE